MYSGGFRKVLIRFLDLLFNKVVYFRFLRQFRITGIVEFFVISPFPHHCIIDTHDGRNKFFFVSNGPDFLYKGTEFQPGLKVLWRKRSSITQGHHIFGTVKHHEVAVFIYKSPVSGIQPAIHQGFFRGLVILIIPLKNRGALGENFPLFRDLDFGIRNGSSNRIKFDVAVSMDYRNACHFRLAVYLLQVDSERVKEFEMIRPHGSAACIAVP